MTSAILLVNGQADDPVLQRALRTASFTTSLADRLAALTGHTIVVPDIVNEREHDPAIDLREEIARFDNVAMLARSAGYGYTLRAASHPNVRAVAIWYGNLADPQIVIPRVPTLVVTCGRDFWSSEEAAEAFVARSGAERIHLPDAQHAFDVGASSDAARDAITRTAAFLAARLPAPDRG